MDISNGSVVITGGAGGFGGATARRLAKLGAKVVVADVADERGQALAAEIGNGSVYVRTDIMSEDSVVAAVEAASKLVVGPSANNAVTARVCAMSGMPSRSASIPFNLPVPITVMKSRPNSMSAPIWCSRSANPTSP